MLAAAMLPAGLLGDRYGHKRVFLISLALFAVGSAACAFSMTVDEFMAARVLLGLAGAGVIVMSISSLTVLFNKQERPKAVGILAAGNFLAMPIGPILGGWLLTNFWWGWVFLVNVPVALIGLVAATALLPEFRASEPPAFDLPGVAASVLGLRKYPDENHCRSGSDACSDLASVGSATLSTVLSIPTQRIVRNTAPSAHHRREPRPRESGSDELML